MSSSRRSPRPARWLVLAAALSACHGSAPASASAKRYTVRAEVVTVPARPGGELVLRHEAIPDFTDRSGAVVGMHSMVMPFPVGASVPLASLAPGDKIEAVLLVDWTQGRYLIERVKKLPPETPLELGAAHGKAATGSRASADARE